MDNCTSENKNKYTLGYLEKLVSLGVFAKFYALFLPIGHTHTDKYQLFSRTATHLRKVDALTLEDLHTELAKSYTPAPLVNNIQAVANFSGLCDSMSLN